MRLMLPSDRHDRQRSVFPSVFRKGIDMIRKYATISAALVAVCGFVSHVLPAYAPIASAFATLVTAIGAQLAHNAEPPSKAAP